MKRSKNATMAIMAILASCPGPMLALKSSKLK